MINLLFLTLMLMLIVITFSFIDSKNLKFANLTIDNSLYHAPNIKNQHLNQIGLRSIQYCLEVKSFLINILFNFSICFFQLTLIDKIDYIFINIQHRQDRHDRIRFYIEFTKIEVEMLKGKGYTVSII